MNKDKAQTDFCNRFLKGLNRIALCCGYGTLVSSRQIQLGTTADIIKDNSGSLARLIHIQNRAVTSADDCFIGIDPIIQEGYVIPAGEHYGIILAPGMKLYGKFRTTTNSIRVLEYAEIPL